MSNKFIPNGDTDFITKAESFARVIARDPAKLQIEQSDSDAMSAAAVKFRAALQACYGGGKSAAATRAKRDARLEAVQIMRRLGHLLRVNPRIDAATKVSLEITPRSEKPKQLLVPNEPPRLRFLRAHHESAATPMHELAFTSLDFKSRPPGAVRLELFVDLTSPDEAIPAFPGANDGGRPWYLRSFTRSPIKLIPPMARVPMRVVYWGRWADSQGNVGPFSTTAVAWIEGGSQQLLPGGTGLNFNLLGGKKAVPILEGIPENDPATRDEKYSIALLEVRYGTINAEQLAAALPSPVQPGVRQLEAPAENEAA